MHHGQNKEKQKTQIKQKNINLEEIWRKYINICENRVEIYKCCGDRGEYAICIIGLGDGCP